MWYNITRVKKNHRLLVVTFKSHGVAEGYRHHFLRVDSSYYKLSHNGNIVYFDHLCIECCALSCNRLTT